MGVFDTIGKAFTAPINAVGQVISSVNPGNIWDDFTGKTAANMSAEAANRNTQKQLDWEHERATHAHQWEVQDLEAAGLNPILSAGGSGAQTSGITPQMPDYSLYKGSAGAISQILSLATGIQDLQINSATAKANIDNLNSKTGLNEAKSITEGYLQGKYSAETALSKINQSLSKLDVEHYEELFKNKISYNFPGLIKEINNWLKDTLEDYGITPEGQFNKGASLFDLKENLKVGLKNIWEKYKEGVNKGNKYFEKNLKKPDFSKVSWYR